MPRHDAPFKVRLVGPPERRRFVISKWSRRLRDARLYADPDDVEKTIRRLSRRHLRRHEPKRLYLLTIIVRVHADENVSRYDVEKYLAEALVVGVVHDRVGTGPTADSLVEVVIPAISLEEGH